MTIDEAVRNVFEKSEICYENKVISKENLLKEYASFVSSTIDKEGHNVGLVLQPGSICFDVISVVIAGVMNLINNETDSKEVIQSLTPGDIVIYEKGRYVFSEIIDGGTIDKKRSGIKYVVLTQERTTKYGSSSKTYLAESSWRKILPYNGQSRLTNGRGIKQKDSVRELFFKDVLGYAEEDIPSVIDTSSVIVMPHSKADDLVNNISFKFSELKMTLLQLLTASYYSEEEEYSYSGNAAKNEPILKFCGKISVARKQILSRRGNRHIGLMVLGQDTIDRSQSELPELLERKSLKYIYLSTTIDSGYGYGYGLLKENPDLNLFACTKDFLNERNLLEVQEENNYTIELNKRVFRIKDSEVLSVLIEGFPLKTDDEIQLKETLLRIKRNEYESEEKEEFVLKAYSFINLLKTAAFTMEEVERVCKKDNLGVELPSEKIKRLDELVGLLPSSIKNDSETVVAYIREVYESLIIDNPKKDWLEQHLYENKDKKIAVVVPKAYYISVLRDRLCFSPVLIRRVTFVTAVRFDSSKSYDEIIVLGDFSGKRFDAFRCSSSNIIIGLFYSVEINGFHAKKMKKEQDDYLFNSKSSIKVNNLKTFEPEEEIKNPEYERLLDEELNEYLEKATSLFDTNIKWDGRENKGNLTTEIVAIATMEDERRVFFSRHYKAYVFDANSGETKEVESQDLCEGDSIVFTKNNDNTKDIVDSMLQQLIEDGKLPEKTVISYEKSREWKQSLRDYMVENKITLTEVANRLIELGAPVQQFTIMRWMDEDTHTVGPKKAQSLELIGRLTGNNNLTNEYESYFLACKEIRSIRRNLLGQIGEAIIKKLNGKKPLPGSIFSDVYDKIDDLSEVLQIERIVFTEKVMPLALANRPLNMRGE